MFGRNIRDKLPGIHQPLEKDEETGDRGKEKKGKEKLYADSRRHAKSSSIEEGDEVAVKRAVKSNKLSSMFEPTVHRVLRKRGAEATVEAEDTKRKYRRNVSHLKKGD